MSHPLDPLATSPAVTPTDSTNDYRAPIPAPCYACGAAAHGPVGHQILCLQVTLKGERERSGRLVKALQAIGRTDVVSGKEYLALLRVSELAASALRSEP